MRVLRQVRARDLSSTPKKPLGSDIKITVVLLDSGTIESEGVFVETGNVAITKTMYPNSWFKPGGTENQKIDEVLGDMKRQWENKSDAELVVVEDPFTSNPTYKRDFGEEFYKLNNGAIIQICWLETNSNPRKSIKNGSIWSDSYGFEINSLGSSSSVTKSIYEKTIIVSPPSGLSGDEKDRITIVDGKIKGINKDKVPKIPSDIVGSYGSTFSGQTPDLEIINTLISKWKINVPNYDKLALINPTTVKTSEWRKFESEGKITIPTGALSIITDDPNYIGEKKNGFPTHGYKSPLVNNPPEEEKPKDPPPKANEQEPPKVNSTPTEEDIAKSKEVQKIKITVQLPEGEVIKVKEDISSIIVTVGEIDKKLPNEELDPEYTEPEFEGQEESSTPEKLAADNAFLQQLEQNSKINPPPQTQTGAGTGAGTGGANVNQGQGSGTPQNLPSIKITQGKWAFETVPGDFSTNSGLKIKCVAIDGYLVNINIAGAFLDMQAAAAKDGVAIRVKSGFRSPYDSYSGVVASGYDGGKIKKNVSVSSSSQKYLYDGWLARKPGFNLAAQPLKSDHGNGIALDLDVGGKSAGRYIGVDVRKYEWIVKNSWRFGFVRGVASEEWHVDYRPDIASKGPYAKFPAKDLGLVSTKFYNKKADGSPWGLDNLNIS